MKVLDCRLHATVGRYGKADRHVALPIHSPLPPPPQEAPPVVSSPAPFPDDSYGDVGGSGASEEAAGSAYRARQERLATAWGDVRELLRRATVEGNGLPVGQSCSRCGEAASLRCLDCGAQIFLCSTCADAEHRSKCVFHRVEMWSVSQWCLDRWVSTGGQGIMSASCYSYHHCFRILYHM